MFATQNYSSSPSVFLFLFPSPLPLLILLLPPLQMATTLQQLLVEEGFKTSKHNNNHRKPPTNSSSKKVQEELSDILPLSIYICNDRKSTSNVSNPKEEKKNTKRISSSNFSAFSSKTSSPAMDEVGVQAIVSILSGYVSPFLNNESFREMVRNKCYACLALPIASTTEVHHSSYDNEIIAKFEQGIVSTEMLFKHQFSKTEELKVRSLENLIELLNIVSSINSKSTTASDSTCGVPNSHLSACAQLYLSFVYKLHNNDRLCARHLLQVFCDSPFLARIHLLPDLWEHFFLPHLFHFNTWLAKELESTSNLGFLQRERRVKALNKAYNEGMDTGTKQLALYYKDWLKSFGAGQVKDHLVPSVSLPSILSSNGRRCSESFSSRSNINKNLYQDVFGPNYEPQSRSMDFSGGDKFLVNTCTFMERNELDTDKENIKQGLSVHNTERVHQRCSSQDYRNVKAQMNPETYKSNYSRFFLCRTDPSADSINKRHIVKDDATSTRKPSRYLPSSDFSSAVTTICTSDNLSKCEISVRVIAKAWLDSHGDPIIESALSNVSVIDGMLEVLFASNDDEILELVIAILAELISRKQANREIVLKSDPQLEIFMKLLRSSLFLKSSVLLYLLRPKAEQMLSVDWVPLVLRVLEFGDQLQTLLAVQCSPQVAAFYLLEQLLRGPDMQRNSENARKVVSLGGLSLLLRRLDIGDQSEKNNAMVFIYSCIMADSNCRYYLANNVKKSSILEVLVLENQTKSSWCALSLLTELLCLNRRTQITAFLNGLKDHGGCLNAMHILLVYLQHAPLEQRPLVAAILLQLDLLGDHLQSSLYREEVVDAIVETLDFKICNEKVQQQSGRALLLLGGQFSCMGEALAEMWLLKQAGYSGGFLGDSLHGNEIFADEINQSNEEEDAIEDWLRKMATALFMSGKKRLLIALSESIANAIPSLSRASLVTVAWMSRSLSSIKNEYLQSIVCSIFMPQLLETLNYDRQLEERVLASLSLLSLVKNSEYLSKYVRLDKDAVDRLCNLAHVTWTAEELLSIAMNNLNCSQHTNLEIITG